MLINIVCFHSSRLVTLARIATAIILEERFGESRASVGVRMGLTTPALSGRFFMASAGRH
jgi:hypothetical protein